MIDHLGVVVTRLERSVRFYEAALRPLGIRVLERHPYGAVILGRSPEDPFLWVGTARPSFWTDAHVAGAAPLHLSFVAPHRGAVDAFHAQGLEHGGVDNGAPGPRKTHYPYYAAYLIDPDGNNIEAGVRGDAPLPATLTTARLTLRPIVDEDVDALTEILAEPGVAAFWPGYDRDRVLYELATPDGQVTVLAMVLDGVVVGAIQHYSEGGDEYRHAGIDLFLSDAVRGQGLGPEAIRAVHRHLVHDRGHHRIVIDPAADNVAAIRAYEKAGFARVGVCRRRERGPAGWRDSLLMEWVDG